MYDTILPNIITKWGKIFMPKYLTEHTYSCNKGSANTKWVITPNKVRIAIRIRHYENLGIDLLC